MRRIAEGNRWVFQTLRLDLETGEATVAAAAPGEEPPAAAPAGPGEEFIQAFAENLLVAEWLAGYDVAARYSGDAFMALPKEERAGATNWFRCEEKDGWHAVYGRWDGAKEEFHRMVRFRVDAPDKVVRIDDLAGREFDAKFCRALADSGPRFLRLKEACRPASTPTSARSRTVSNCGPCRRW